MRRALLVASAATLGCTAVRPHESPAPRVVSAPARWDTVHTTSLPAGTIAGRVTDDSTGAPIGGVQLLVLGDSARPVATAISDTAGQFRLDSVPPGGHRVRLRRIGYARAELRLTVDGATGTRAAIALRADRLTFCAQYLEPITGLSVLVYDAVTGAPPAGPLQLMLGAGRFRDTSSATRTDSAHTHRAVYAHGWRPGTYDVLVRAPGYRPWRAHAVRIPPMPSCNHGPVSLTAWLLPDA